MCYKKKEIKNPIHEDHRTGFDKVKLKVACCKCPSCRRVKSNDWLVRSYFEMLGNENQAFFVTLDYDNYHLPHFNGVACWDHDNLKMFFDRLRHYVGKFRYMYATDYGGFLKRPHYHLVIVPYSRFDKGQFFQFVQHCWTYGTHSDLQILDSVNGSCMAAVEYVCGYVNKDIAFNPDEDTYKDMPMRCRPRVQASKGYGLRALEEGLITSDMLLTGKKVSLPIGKNGRIVQLPIPRYYEMKLAYDYSYDKENKKVSLLKNDFGVKLAQNRHNAYYVYFIKQFFASRHAVSDTLGFRWLGRVRQCLDDIEDFSEFIYYRPFISYLGHSIRDNIRNEWLYRPRWQYYEVSVKMYEEYQKELDQAKCALEVQQLIDAAKARCRRELQNNPKKYFYLRSRGYDFRQIFN